MAVWLFRLDSTQVPSALATLSATEQERAARFSRAIDRQHWVCSRVQLRRILGWVTGQPPASVSIDRDARGKPKLNPPSSARTVEFSISHSGGFGMVAVAGSAPVGVDLEEVEQRWSVLEELLDSTLALSERDWVVGNPEPAVAFTGLWTRKEAVLKFLGTGLLTDMRDVVLVGTSGLSPTFGTSVNTSIPADGLVVIDIVSPIGYCAALAVARATQRVTVFVESPIVTN